MVTAPAVDAVYGPTLAAVCDASFVALAWSCFCSPAFCYVLLVGVLTQVIGPKPTLSAVLPVSPPRADWTAPVAESM